MDMSISFVETRARRTDPQTSHDAAQHAASGKAANQRIVIRRALERVHPFGLTAKELAQETGLDYITVGKRLSEVALIERTDAVRDGCREWRAI